MDYVAELNSHLRVLTDKLKTDLQGVRSNRPSVELIENIQVPAYGQTVPIKGLGSISVVPPREIQISLWDRTVIQAVAKAIDEARVGLTVQTDGTLVRAMLSALGNERREELMKTVKKTGEETRIAIRGRRDEAMKHIKAAMDSKELSEDVAFKIKEKVQKAVEDANSLVEQTVEKKIAELGE
jgi:ribosome recycling factor